MTNETICCVSSVNDAAAERVRSLLAESGTLAVALLGPSGTGKTSLIHATATALAGKARVAAIVAHPAADRDRAQLGQSCAAAIARAVVAPSALEMLKAIESLDLQNLDVLLIEAIGEAEGGVPDLGHDATAALFAASGGDDKAAECAALVAAADVILLSKMNLLPHVSFDRELFEADVLQANPSAERIDIDVDDADSLQRWTQWLTRQGLCKRLGAQSRSGEQIRPEFFVG